MIDYLGRLAARTLAPERIAGARPRVASAYEMAPVAPTRPAATDHSTSDRRGRLSLHDGVVERRAPRPPDFTPAAADVAPAQPSHHVAQVLQPAPPPPPDGSENPPYVEAVAPVETVREHTTIIDRPRVVERLAVRREREIERIVERVIEQQQQQQQAAPIEITINRIDVRAGVTPPAVAPRPKRPAVMTLEEYVARRDGERR